MCVSLVVRAYACVTDARQFLRRSARRREAVVHYARVSKEPREFIYCVVSCDILKVVTSPRQRARARDFVRGKVTQVRFISDERSSYTLY